MYFKYLDFPHVPKELLKSSPGDFTHEKNIFRIPSYRPYRQYDVGQELLTYIQQIIPYEFHCSYQVIRKGIDIHKDGGRTECVNYIIATGGDNATLNIYNDGKEIIFTEKIHPFRWHWINVGMYHDVTGIDSVRISLTLNIFNKSFK